MGTFPRAQVGARGHLGTLGGGTPKWGGGPRRRRRCGKGKSATSCEWGRRGDAAGTRAGASALVALVGTPLGTVGMLEIGDPPRG